MNKPTKKKLNFALRHGPAEPTIKRQSWLPDWVTGLDRENVAAGEAAANKVAILNAAENYGPAYDAAVALNASRSQIGDVDTEINNATSEGFNDGVRNVRGTIGNVVSVPFRIIPWQLYVIGAVFLFLYMGGGTKLRNILK